MSEKGQFVQVPQVLTSSSEFSAEIKYRSEVATAEREVREGAGSSGICYNDKPQ